MTLTELSDTDFWLYNAFYMNGHYHNKETGFIKTEYLKENIAFKKIPDNIKNIIIGYRELNIFTIDEHMQLNIISAYCLITKKGQLILIPNIISMTMNTIGILFDRDVGINEKHIYSGLNRGICPFECYHNMIRYNIYRDGKIEFMRINKYFIDICWDCVYMNETKLPEVHSGFIELLSIADNPYILNDFNKSYNINISPKFEKIEKYEYISDILIEKNNRDKYLQQLNYIMNNIRVSSDFIKTLVIKQKEMADKQANELAAFRIYKFKYVESVNTIMDFLNKKGKIPADVASAAKILSHLGKV